MHSPRQPKDNYQGREAAAPASLGSCLPVSAPGCAVCCSSTSSSPGAMQGMACSCFTVPLPLAQNQAACARRHISASSTRVPHWCPCRSLLWPRFRNYFLFIFFFFTTELTVIATSRDVGYHFQTETRQLHAFSEQNKTGNLKQLLCYIQTQGIFGARARPKMY